MHRKPPLQVDWYCLHRPLGPQKHLHVQVLLSLHPLLPLHLREFSPARTSRSQLQIQPDRASTWQSTWEAASAPALATDSPAALPVCTSLLLQLHWSCLGPGTQPSLCRQTPSQLLERGPDRSLQPRPPNHWHFEAGVPPRITGGWCRQHAPGGGAGVVSRKRPHITGM